MRLGFDSIRMPDRSHQRDRVDEFARNAPALAATSGRGNGGVLLARNGKSYIVNVRPPKWNDKNKPSQFWIGKVARLQLARYYADAVLHYCGKARFHFRNVDFTFPPLECIGAKGGTPVRLTTTEQCLKYVQSIAGKGFAPQREDFVRKVEKMIKSAKFILEGERLLSLRENRMQNSVVVEMAAALPREEAPALPREEAPALPREEAARIDDNDARADRETPVEEDDVSMRLMANLVSGYAPSKATVAGFELNTEKLSAGVSGESLQSVEESLGPTYYDLDDCPEARDEGWDKVIEDLNKSSAFGGIMNSAARASPTSTSNAIEVYQEGVKNIPPSVFEGVSFLSGTKFVVVASRERVLSLARGDSEDMPSMQPALNSHVQASSVDHPSDWTPGLPSCQPSVPPALMLLCELNHGRVVEKVQAQSFLMPTANRVLGSDDGFDSAAVHTTAEAEQLKNAKRQRIGV